MTERDKLADWKLCCAVCCLDDRGGQLRSLLTLISSIITPYSVSDSAFYGDLFNGVTMPPAKKGPVRFHLVRN